MPGIWHRPCVWGSGLARRPRTAGASRHGRGWILTQTHRGGRSGAVPGMDLALSCKAALGRAFSLICEVLTNLARDCISHPSSFLPPAKPCVTILSCLVLWRCWALQLRSLGRSLRLLLSPSRSTERLMEMLGLAGLLGAGGIHPA